MMNYADFETNIVSIERVTEFIETPKEVGLDFFESLYSYG